MAERLFRKTGFHYILAMMIVTRVSGSVGGFLVVYYVDVILGLPEPARTHFHIIATLVVLLALALTTLWSLVETQNLRAVLKRLHYGLPVSKLLGQRAAWEAFTFPGRHHRVEAWLVPTVTLIPVLIILKVIDDVSISVMINITLAVHMGVGLALMSTYFMIERFMRPVVRYLLENGVAVDYGSLPVNRLRIRLTVCFSILITTTALMIAMLARQRGEDIRLGGSTIIDDAIANLQEHSLYILVAAVGVGVMYSTALAGSVASRVNQLLEAMKRVEGGSFEERLYPTSNDEIDILSRQFNAMVVQLKRNDRIIRDLNANLEMKVDQRTRELTASERELHRSLEQLRENDRLKTEFFANVSHELRTPLTMILSPVDRILDTFRDQLSEESLALLRVVRINGQRLLELINRLLEFSKLEAGKTRLREEAVDLNQLIVGLAEAARPLAQQRGVQLRLELEESLPVTLADEEKLEIVLTNLVSNALKFTLHGGWVTVTTRRQDNRLRVEVQDTGIGIAAEDHHRVFERFVQIDGSTSREHAGTGLGLPLAREFVELHGGTMGLISELAAGACFWFELPWREPETDAGRRTSPRTGTAAKQRFVDLEVLPELNTECEQDRGPESGPRILVVDDTAEIRVLLTDILAAEYRVLLARDGQEGWERAQRDKPQLIISDVMMPQVDGYEFCRRVKSHETTRQIPFIMLTAKAERTMKIEGLEQGADEYLVKPFDAKELQARVRNMLNVRRLTVELGSRNQELEQTLAQLREMQNQLVQSEKMSSLGQLVAGLAHEINNAINAVYNGIKPLQIKTTQLRERVFQALPGDQGANATDNLARETIQKAFDKIALLASVIEEGATRTARIVSDMKTFSHPGNEASAPFDIHEVLDMCLNLLASQLKNRITVLRDFQAQAELRGPRGQLGQVFLNLLSNAQQAIQGEGDIRIITRDEGPCVAVHIQDSGMGIPPEIISRIFDPFFTTKEPGVGTGLGLSISYGIIRRVGGTIECFSEPDAGTEFVVRLPHPKPAPQETGNPIPPGSRPANSVSPSRPQREHAVPKLQATQQTAQQTTQQLEPQTTQQPEQTKRLPEQPSGQEPSELGECTGSSPAAPTADSAVVPATYTVEGACVP